MNKKLRIQILEYLLEKDAVDHKIDAALKFLEYDDSRESRVAVKDALNYLQTQGLIELSGRPLDMLNTTAGQYPSKYHTDLKASITLKGEEFLKSTIANVSTKAVNTPNSINSVDNRSTFVFISHSSLDKEIVSVFIDKILKLVLKIETDEIFCTSLHETSIENGKDFKKAIKENLEKATLVIQIITQNYKESEVCLNEMGAAWVLNNKVVPFILFPVEYDSVGFIHQPNQQAKLNDKNDLIKFIDEEKKAVSRIRHTEIERHVNEFLESLNQIKPVIAIPKPKKMKREINELGLSDGDIVAIVNREGLYLYENDKLIYIVDDSSFSQIAFGFDKRPKKSVTYFEASSLIDISITIPALKTCQIVIDDVTRKKWILINGERRFLPDSVYIKLTQSQNASVIEMDHKKLLGINEGDMLFDVLR